VSLASPKSALLEGAEIPEKVLASKGFHFQFHGEGKSSGGTFAWGEFVRGDRRIELHVRFNLGLVRYHAGTESKSHDYYMRELGVRDQCHYPGFSEDSKEAFLGLAHDLLRQGKYEDALAEFKRLEYPERLSESDRKMVELARKRTHVS